MRFAFGICLALTSIATAARAEPAAPAVDVRPDTESFDDRHRPEAEPWRNRPFAVETQLGLGGPLGLAGVAFDVSPSPGFSLNVGAGVGRSTGSPQLGTSLRMRVIIAQGVAVGAEGGMAVGRYEESVECPGRDCPPEWHWERAVWGHVGLMLEHRSASGLALRWSFGGTGIFNVTSAECVRCDATDEPSMWNTTVPYTLVAAGWAFSP